MVETYQVVTRMEEITEQEDKYLAGAKKEIRNSLMVLIPENPFPEIEVSAYPPLKFSWVIPKKIAAMALPRNKENLQYLKDQGITYLVTLCEKKPPIEDPPVGLRWSQIPLEEFSVPSQEDIKTFVNICRGAEKSDDVLGIHCRQGRSRCGVMLACYLVYFHKFEADQAVNVIRMIRPGSCDSPELEEAVHIYYQSLSENNRSKFGVTQSVIDDMIEEAKTINKRN